jgi:hypothetical protein
VESVIEITIKKIKIAISTSIIGTRLSSEMGAC